VGPKRILVVDDEGSMVQIIRYALEEAGYTVEAAGDAEAAAALVDGFRPDLVVLDVMLPGQSGLEFVRELRGSSDVPVIMLSARSEEIDKVLGLEVGADDYVTKPFSPRELVSRVKAQLRRSEAGPQRRGGAIEVGGLRVDPESRQVFARGVEVHLTNSEFQILELLARSPGKAFTRMTIMDRLWSGAGFVGDDRAVDVHVHNIRDKIESDPSDPEYVLTVRGVGYRLRES
jgi:two-component system alkaline phosphatase synthesis response regulator PhoP